jgi:hypothetical protein
MPDHLTPSSLNDWLSLVARPTPVWAGGSVAALACAQGWALLEMVAGLAQKRQPAVDLGFQIALARQARSELMRLASADATAFRRVMEHPGPDTFLPATEVPLAIWQWAHEGLGVSAHPSISGYAPAHWDRELACQLFRTVEDSLRSLVSANLSHLHESDQDRIQDRVRRMEAEI